MLFAEKIGGDEHKKETFDCWIILTLNIYSEFMYKSLEKANLKIC